MVPEPVMVLVPTRELGAGTMRMKLRPAAVVFAHTQPRLPTRVQLRFCRSSFAPVVRRFFFETAIVTAEFAHFK